MGNLLISEPPLQVLPSLAVKVGLNEAIVLQQFHYWLNRSNNERDGYKWIYNSYTSWHKQFPFWSIKTLKRAITSLEKDEFLISGNYNKAGFDKTKWYRINYEKLEGQPLGQNGPTNSPECPNGVAQNGPTNTNRLPETTTEITTNSTASADQFPWQEVISFLNEQTGKHFRNTDSNKRLIMARHKEGFTLDEMKTVIVNQSLKWENDLKMNQYLRPSTLFQASKFEGYLNDVPRQQQQGGWFD
ncbi:replication protein [Lactiplantibacillus plantarum]|uniref:conserved phage C-terminal domain-containing protein n=1 Tax=Lactiplantibacillus plantarum TaxID=1590 RepID=UPI0007BB81AE|nr:conserved phage C-terminal domain-containing protein [Lactiplantibacillus plantarum]KZU55214.1 Replication protein O [Lactiplantibacillus plantarum]MCB7151936.1 conserved phage C-terminal domain-containing protein [Lactiplantibacillus plantarum]MCB7171440.1 conserved phage C-terminal domain-containing protein [Lactiplantibacillus plantarum]MDN7060886.1 replication protein [Lactiplantibacillus plantarum]QIL58121.1 replication protein [Lactiplantibacillus plantarum]